MTFALKCDSCEFADTVEDEGRAYTLARDHEADETTHFVGIETVEEEPTPNE